MIDDLAALRARMQDHEPTLAQDAQRQRAAVALVLHEADGALSLLMIMRAESEGDRWSGDIAFPGGRVDAADASSRATAERETLEEVGIALGPDDYIGRLDDLQGSAESIAVSAYVYGIAEAPPLVPNHEVARAFWTPIPTLLDEANHVERDFRYREHQLPLPALRVLDPEHPLLWGLSYRFLEMLMKLLGASIPPMPWDRNL